MEKRELSKEIAGFSHIIHAWDTVISVKSVYSASYKIDKKSEESLRLQLNNYVNFIDETFSTFKNDSLIAKVNSGDLTLNEARKINSEFDSVFTLASEARMVSNSLFNFEQDTGLDFNAIVKGYAAQRMLEIVKTNISEFISIMVNAGGDCAVESAKKINVGLTDPDDIGKIYQSIEISLGGVSTSGTYIRGAHIKSEVTPFLSASVWGPNPALADAYATAALLSKDLNLSWLPREYKYSIIPNPMSRVVYQNPSI